jgi:hypothetical protein
VRMCAYVCVCVRMCAYVCVCVRMCAYVCVCVRICAFRAFKAPCERVAPYEKARYIPLVLWYIAIKVNYPCMNAFLLLDDTMETVDINTWNRMIEGDDEKVNFDITTY